MSENDVVQTGWSAADVDPAELVDDEWIRQNTAPGKAPSKVRGILRKLQSGGGLTRDQMRRIAARTGYPYVEAWSTRNEGQMKGVWGAMLHHTGTANTAAGDYPTLKIVRDGRSDLQNSLCAFGLGRSGTIYLVSEKLSWHAGAGNWNGMTDGNGYAVGIEAESDGVHWTAEEKDAYPRLVASILVEIKQDDKYTTRHASYALPAGRKVDTGGLDMDAFWNKVYFYLANPEQINKDYVALPPIIGRISDAYARPGIAGTLGDPLGPEVPTAGSDTIGRWQEFERGAIFWHPNVDGGNAHVVAGDNYKLWTKLNREVTTGFPLTDELTTPDGAGRFNHFADGWSIYWTQATGSHEVHGLIRVAWEKAGWEKAWGYPTTGEVQQADGTITQQFTKGAVTFKSGVATFVGKAQPLS